MKTQIVLLLSLSLLIFGACKKENKCTQGNGDIVQETRPLDEYTSASFNGAYNISVAPINASQIDLFGESNILPLIKSTVVNKALTVGTTGDDCYETSNTIEVTLSTPLLNSLRVNGAGNVTALNMVQDGLSFETNGSAVLTSQMDVNTFSTTIRGSGDANFAGTADDATFTITGAGNIFGNNLFTEKCTIVISGAGDVRINVSTSLNVTISGSGSVYYTGDPQDVTSNISGTGGLIKEG